MHRHRLEILGYVCKVRLRIVKVLILPIGLSTCILTKAMCLPSCTSFVGSHCRPSRNVQLDSYFLQHVLDCKSTICHNWDTSLVLYTIQKSRYTCKFNVWYSGVTRSLVLAGHLLYTSPLALRSCPLCASLRDMSGPNMVLWQGMCPGRPGLR